MSFTPDNPFRNGLSGRRTASAIAHSGVEPKQSGLSTWRPSSLDCKQYNLDLSPPPPA